MRPGSPVCTSTELTIAERWLDSFACHRVTSQQGLTIFFAQLVRYFEGRFRSDRSVYEDSFFRARRYLSCDNDNQRQRVTLLKDQQLASKKISFDVSLLYWLDPGAQFDWNFLHRRISRVFHNQG